MLVRAIYFFVILFTIIWISNCGSKEDTGMNKFKLGGYRANNPNKSYIENNTYHFPYRTQYCPRDPNIGPRAEGDNIESDMENGFFIDAHEDVTVTTNTSAVTTFDSSYSAVIELFWAVVDKNEIYNVTKAYNLLRTFGADAVLIPSSLSNENVMFSFPNPGFYLLEIKEASIVKYPSSKNTADKTSCNLDIYPISREYICQLPKVHSDEVYQPIAIHMDDHVTKMVVTLFYHLGWTSVYILYDKSTADTTSNIMTEMSLLGKLVTMYRIDMIDVVGYRNLIHRIHDTAHVSRANITLICSKQSAAEALKQANSFDQKNIRRTALGQRTQWIVISLDNHEAVNVTELASELDNVVTITIPRNLKSVQSKKLETKNIEEPVSHIINRLHSKLIGYNATNSSLNNRKLIESLLQESKKSDCHCVPIETMMFVPNGRGLNTAGYLCTTGHLKQTYELFPNNKFGFNGRKFIVSTLEWKPFTINNGNMSYGGLCMHLLNHLATELNFTYKLTQPEDGEWGVKGRNNSWTGLTGQLQRHEVDLVGAPLGILAGREMVMDFMTSFHYEYSVILMRKPDPNTGKWRTFIDPFKTEVLICTLVTLPLASLALYFVERLSPYYSKRSAGGLHTFQNAFWYMYGAILTQGGEHKPESSAGRTLLSFWWLFCIIMMATYSGNLVAFLTVNKDPLPFKTLNGLLEQNVYKWGTAGGTIWVAMFQETHDPELAEVWEGIVKYNKTDKAVLALSSAAHMQKALDEDYAYIGDKTQSEIRMASECRLQLAKQEFLPLQYAFGLPNHSPYTKLFSKEILKVHEAGLLHVWKRKLWPTMNTCENSLISDATTIKLIDVQSAFYMIGIGVVLSFIICIFENILNSARRRFHHDKPDIPNVVQINK